MPLHFILNALWNFSNVFFSINELQGKLQHSETNLKRIQEEFKRK